MHGENNESVHKRIGILRTKAAKCQYKEYNRLLTQQFISWHNDDGMVNEILKEAATLQDIEDAMNEHVLLWIQRVEAQRVKKLALNKIKEAKD